MYTQFEAGKTYYVPYTGEPLPLATAPWKASVEAIYDLTSDNAGLIAFRPGAQVNNLSQLVDRRIYQFVVKTAFRLPTAQVGAVQAIAPELIAVDTPYIFFTTQTWLPGRPGVVVGHFSAAAQVYAYATGSSTRILCPPVVDAALRVPQVTHVTIPASVALDRYRLVVVDGATTSPEFVVNQARGLHFDWPDTTPGAYVRLFGRNLLLASGSPKLFFQAGDSTRYEAAIDLAGSRQEVLRFKTPDNLPLTQSFRVFVRNGLGGVDGETEVSNSLYCLPAVSTSLPVEPRVAVRHAKLGTVKTPADALFSKHPVGDGTTNDTAALRQCLYELCVAGGGVLDGQGKTFYLEATDFPASGAKIWVGTYLYNCTLKYGGAAPPSSFGYGIFADQGTIGLIMVSFQNLNATGNYSANFFFGGNADLLLVKVKGLFTGEPVTIGAGAQRVFLDECELVNRYADNTQHFGPLNLPRATDVWIRNLKTLHEVGQNAVQGGRNVLIENPTYVRDAAINQQGKKADTRLQSFNLVENFTVLGGSGTTINGTSADNFGDGEQLLNEGGGPAQYRPDAEYGRVTSATSTTLTDSTATFGGRGPVTAAAVLCITGGRGMGQQRQVASSTSTTLTVAAPWQVVPDTTSVYTLTNWSAKGVTILDYQGSNNRAGVVFFQASCWDVLVRGLGLKNSQALMFRPYQATGEASDNKMANFTRILNAVWGVEVYSSSSTDDNNPYAGVPAYIGISASLTVAPLGPLVLGAAFYECEVNGRRDAQGRPAYQRSRYADGSYCYNDSRQANGFVNITDCLYVDPQLGFGGNGEVPVSLGVLFWKCHPNYCAAAYSVDSTARATVIQTEEPIECLSQLADQAIDANTHGARLTHLKRLAAS